MAHTKGKWEVRNRNIFVMHGKTRIFIASVFKCMPGGKTESQANARLIASAPETAAQRDALLEACKLAKTVLIGLNFKPCGMVMKQLKAAIDKAKTPQT